MKNEINRLATLLKERKQTLALAESITGGMAAQHMANIKGASGIFSGGVVCYRPEVKIQLLGLSKRLIELYTCESQQVTDELAKQLSKRIKADVYGAITGLSSKGASENKNKPVGTVFITALYRGKLVQRRKLFRGKPMEIKKKACTALYGLLLEVMTSSHV